MATWESILEDRKQLYLDELLELLRIPSISADPGHADDIGRAADWVAARLARAGAQNVRLLDPGNLVYGEYLYAPAAPTVLIYDHFDVQPADPLEMWLHPPFEPFIEAGRVFARGASDSKANLLMPILALEAMRLSGEPPQINLKFIFEGQEEIGSPHLAEAAAEHRDILACDLVVSADGGQWSETDPMLILGLKGVCALQIDVHGPSRDLHSGLFGGAVQNPIHALVRLIDSMRSPDGSVTVAGFYSHVKAMSTDDRSRAAHLPFDDAHFRAALGVTELFGESGYSTYERVGFRPTLEVNGIWGGFQGDGTKTVIPSSAHAKISCRLVPEQEPEEILAHLAEHVVKHRPVGVRVDVTPLPGRARPYSVPADHFGNVAASQVLRELYGRSPMHMRLGGTLPVCDIFLSELGAYTVMMGFSLDDERHHSPNEFLRLSSYERGQRAYARLYQELAQNRQAQ